MARNARIGDLFFRNLRCFLRLSPRFDLLKNKITSRGLGEIFHFEADYLYGRLEKLLSGWRSLDPNYSVTLGGAIHLVDLIMWLIEEKPNRVPGRNRSQKVSLPSDERF